MPGHRDAALVLDTLSGFAHGVRTLTYTHKQTAQAGDRTADAGAADGTGPGTDVGRTSAPTERPEPQRPTVDVLTERGGVLTPAGTLVVEPSLASAHDSSERVVIEGLSVLPVFLVGGIDVRRVDSDIATASLSGRYGVTSRLEVEAPYTYRQDSTTAREIAGQAVQATVTEAEGRGLGDMEFAARYQLTDGGGGWPVFIGNMRVRAPTGRDPFEVETNAAGLQTELPTGSGFWAAEPSLSFLLQSAPLVWFGNARYRYTFERDIGGGFGTIDPGDADGGSVGIAYAVNPRSAFSIAWDQEVTFETGQDGSVVPASDVNAGSAVFGFTYRLDDRVSINLQFQAGVADDATDSVATVPRSRN